MFHLPFGGAMNSEKNPQEAKPIHIYHIWLFEIFLYKIGGLEKKCYCYLLSLFK